MTIDAGVRWVRFLRQYGPIPRNDNMYDEHIRRYAKWIGVRPLGFKHPVEDEVLALFSEATPRPLSVMLTGTAGDGKSYLCWKIWQLIGGSETKWLADEPYFKTTARIGGKDVNLHVIRDLTGMPEPDTQGRYVTKAEVLIAFSKAITEPEGDDVFVVAANDGQLIETWQALPDTPEVVRTRALFESLLLDGPREEPGISLRLFNLSRVPCADLFDLALHALLTHEGWSECEKGAGNETEFFGSRCPIRHNYELLRTPLVRSRLRALFELCDQNDFHIPIRRILVLLANTLLGHPEAKDRLLRAEDVPGVIQRKTISGASLFNNVFGGNLTESRRESLEVFSFLNRFRIGHETSNRIDNILLFGALDDNFKPYFDPLLRDDTFYGADERYFAAQRGYTEAAEGDDAAARAFLDLLVAQRRGLFFKIPPEQEEELALWELTVFKSAGQYLSRVLDVLRAGKQVDRSILTRLVRGLNRVFVGMLVNTDRELLLATSLSHSGAKVSQILEDRISVSPRQKEWVKLILHNDRPALVVQLSQDNYCRLELNLTRFEFLNRVAEGALPGSFSRECYEDMLAFKTRLLTALAKRRKEEGSADQSTLTLRLMKLDAVGNPIDEDVELPYA